MTYLNRVQHLLRRPRDAWAAALAVCVACGPGAAPAAAADLGQFPGDGHRLFIHTSTPLSALLTGQLKVNYFEFTPIANLIGTGFSSG